jgi:maltooligosyltrehalose trehalohydrolase
MPKPRKKHRIQPPLDLGATVIDQSKTRFRVWCPKAHSVSVRVVDKEKQEASLTRVEGGYWEGTLNDIKNGTQYQYILDNQLERPDPASRFQPDGVHGPSQLVDPSRFQWTDQNWRGLPLPSFIIYEIHTGTFTPEGTFEAIIPQLPYLRDQVGITAVELMPVAQFPGTRNWGYDGAYLFAPQNSYGGPDGLKRLVDACHAHGLAVIMDVVYNHLGPEGNYINDFGPFFTEVYRTPWGSAINYDGPESDAVRNFVVSNAVFWVREYHVDALRLDAIHGIFDFSAKHILQEIGEAVHTEAAQSGRHIYVIAESDLNDSRIISPLSKGGYGLDAQWSDDFHHSLHCLLTGEMEGYYEDFGQLNDLAQAYRGYFVYSGEYSPHRKRRHGNSAKQCTPAQFVICAQNHDQIGNRAEGDRHSTSLMFEALKVANAAVLVSPNIPMLFMGEEYGETAPFLYFIDHSDPHLVEAVRQGRQREFAAFGWSEVPDPYDVQTFERSRINIDIGKNSKNGAHLAWSQSLITLRKTIPSLGTRKKTDQFRVWPYPKTNTLVLFRNAGVGPAALIILGFNKKAETLTLQQPEGTWHCRLDNQDLQFGGPGEHQAPERLSLSKSAKINLTIPPYPAWVYLSESVGGTHPTKL